MISLRSRVIRGCHVLSAAALDPSFRQLHDHLQVRRLASLVPVPPLHGSSSHRRPLTKTLEGHMLDKTPNIYALEKVYSEFQPTFQGRLSSVNEENRGPGLSHSIRNVEHIGRIWSVRVTEDNLASLVFFMPAVMLEAWPSGPNLDNPSLLIRIAGETETVVNCRRHSRELTTVKLVGSSANVETAFRRILQNFSGWIDFDRDENWSEELDVASVPERAIMLKLVSVLSEAYCRLDGDKLRIWGDASDVKKLVELSQDTNIKGLRIPKRDRFPSGMKRQYPAELQRRFAVLRASCKYPGVFIEKYRQYDYIQRMTGAFISFWRVSGQRDITAIARGKGVKSRSESLDNESASIDCPAVEPSLQTARNSDNAIIVDHSIDDVDPATSEIALKSQMSSGSNLDTKGETDTLEFLEKSEFYRDKGLSESSTTLGSANNKSTLRTSSAAKMVITAHGHKDSENSSKPDLRDTDLTIDGSIKEVYEAWQELRTRSQRFIDFRANQNWNESIAVALTPHLLSVMEKECYVISLKSGAFLRIAPFDNAIRIWGSAATVTAATSFLHSVLRRNQDKASA